jgi:Spy/CpxP family protein refolding chaperone
MKKLQLLVTAMCATALFAQTSQRTPPTDQVKTYLSLTDAQVQSLQAIQQQERSALSSVRQQLMQKEQSLAQQMRSGSADATALGNLLVDITNLRKQLTQNQGTYHTQAMAVLTADQQTKLQALQTAASLAPTIRQAEMLNLVTPPAGAAGGPGFGHRFGPGGPGFGPAGGFRGRMHRGPGAPPAANSN